ncbi:hypothetical protein GCM10010392_25260 [Streptomyces clavifer]|nr:hypothetical protein GCM10010392_25260 [Streptomyces clavifer]
MAFRYAARVCSGASSEAPRWAMTWMGGRAAGRRAWVTAPWCHRDAASADPLLRKTVLPDVKIGVRMHRSCLQWPDVLWEKLTADTCTADLLPIAEWNLRSKEL